MIQELLIVLFFFTACADPVQQNGNYKIEVSEKESTNNQNQKKSQKTIFG